MGLSFVQLSKRVSHCASHIAEQAVNKVRVKVRGLRGLEGSRRLGLPDFMTLGTRRW